MSLFALLDGSNVIQSLVEWDGTSQPAQFGALVPASIDPALSPQPGDTYAGGVLTHGVPLVEQHKLQVVTSAQQALIANDAFLALSAPTNAQVLAQVQRLTRQCDGIIRVLFNTFDQIGDT